MCGGVRYGCCPGSSGCLEVPSLRCGQSGMEAAVVRYRSQVRRGPVGPPRWPASRQMTLSSRSTFPESMNPG